MFDFICCCCFVVVAVVVLQASFHSPTAVPVQLSEIEAAPNKQFLRPPHAQASPACFAIASIYFHSRLLVHCPWLVRRTALPPFITPIRHFLCSFFPFPAASYPHLRSLRGSHCVLCVKPTGPRVFAPTRHFSRTPEEFVMSVLPLAREPVRSEAGPHRAANVLRPTTPPGCERRLLVTGTNNGG